MSRIIFLYLIIVGAILRLNYNVIISVNMNYNWLYVLADVMAKNTSWTYSQ